MPSSVPKAIISAVVAFTITSLVSSATFGAQQPGNPLDPSYFSAISGAQSASATGARYVDRHTPLHPTYFAPEGWIETGTPSVPTHYTPPNPLHPAYQKR